MRQKLGEGAKPGYDARVGAGLGRGPNLRKKALAAAWSETFPAPGATLDLDFANNRGFVRGVGQGGAMDAVTFTRASNGTFVGSDGLLKTYANQGALGNNLLTFPQDFDNAAWVKTNSTVVANTEIAPDGTLTADFLSQNGTATTSGRLVAFSASGSTTNDQTLTCSVYLKANQLTWALVYWLQRNATTIQSAYINLSNGSVGTTDGSPTASVSDAGNGWYRCSLTVNSGTGASAPIFRVYLGASDGSVSLNNTNLDGIFIWGAQLEVGSSATTYYPTNINQPRFDWASTAQVAQKNLLTYTEQIDNAVWGKSSVTISANATTDPLSTSTADKVIEAATTSLHQLTQSAIIPSGSPLVGSVYVKKSERTYVHVQVTDSGATYKRYAVLVDLDTGSAVTTYSTNTPVDTSYAITDVGSGWYRISVGLTNTQSTGACFLVVSLSNSSTPTLDANNQPTYTGNTSNGLFVWGAQLEIGSSVTSYQAITQPTTNTPLAANPTSNGLLIEESRANRILWCRDASQTPNRNFLSRSEEFDNSYWTKTGFLAFGSGSVANSTATLDPNGTNTSDLLVENTGNTFHSVQSNTVIGSANEQFTLSHYVKNASGSRWITLVMSESAGSQVAYIHFQPSTNTIGVIGTSGSNWSSVSGTATDVGNGWYRVTLTATLTVIANITDFSRYKTADNGASTYTGDGTSGMYWWGAQLERSSAVSTYESTTTAGAIWSKQGVTAAKTATGIDGVANAATTLTATAANGTLIQPIALASGSRTGSVYLKRITGTGNVQVSLDGSTWSTVDLSSTEWRRIVLSGTVTNPVVGIRLATNGDEVAMDYAQVEDGAFATSPILTTTASVTRAAETSTLFSAPLFANTRNGGTLFCEATYATTPNQGGFVVISDGGNTNRIWLSKGNYAGSNSFDAAVVTNNLTNAGYDTIPTSIKSNQLIEAGNKWRLAVSYTRNSLIFGFNGWTPPFTSSKYTLQASGYNVPNNVDRMNIGTAGAGGSANMTGWISRIIYTPTAVTQVGIVEMTN